MDQRLTAATRGIIMSTRTFPIHEPVSVLARLAHGTLRVDARDGLTEATVTVTAREPGSDIVERIAVEQRGPVIAIVAPRQGGLFDLFGGRRTADAVDVTVTVPTGTKLRLSTFTADITVAGRVGSSDISFGASSATLDEVDGSLRLRYGSGSASVQTVHGSVEMRSGAGDARFGTIHGALDAGRGSGRLVVGEVHGTVRTRAGSGGAVLSAVHSDVDLASGSGEIEIGLPAGCATRLDVVTGTGRVRSDLPIEDAPASRERSITIRARTGSGSVHLFRAS
jgi:hypothetical protein